LKRPDYVNEDQVPNACFPLEQRAEA
jgi:hypothetical protein